jgi:hypothetical protein
MKTLYRQLIYRLINSYSFKRLLATIAISFGLAIALNTTAFWMGIQPMAASGGIQLLDLMPNRSVAETYAQLEAYTAKGRMIYFYSSILLDGLFPVCFGLMFIYILVILYKKTPYEAIIGWPILIVITDLLENLTTAYLIQSYPCKAITVAITGSVCTTIKWSLIGLYLLIVAIGVVLNKTITRKT